MPRRPRLKTRSALSLDQVGLLLSGSNQWGATRTKSGAMIGPMTALEIGAHASCVRLKAKIMAMLPCNVRRRRKSGGSDIDDQHPLHNVLNLRTNKDLLAFQWRTMKTYNESVWGNSCAVINFDNLGRTTELWPALWPNVTVGRWDGMAELTQYDDVGPGDLTYTISKNWPTWSETVWPSNRILHEQGETTINGLIGKSPTDMLRVTLGVAAALRMYEEEFYGEGIRPALIGKMESNTGNKIVAAAIERFKNDFSGWKSGQKLLLPDFPVDLKPVDFKIDWESLSKAEFSVVSEICGFWGFSPTLIGYSGSQYGATYNNAYQFAMQAFTFAIRPQISNDENHFNATLLTPAQYRKWFCKYDPKPLLEMDPEMLAKLIREQFHAGALSPDEIREMDGRNPLPDGKGEATYMQAQMVQVGSEPEQKEETTPRPGLKLVAPETEDMDDAQNE